LATVFFVATDQWGEKKKKALAFTPKGREKRASRPSVCSFLLFLPAFVRKRKEKKERRRPAFSKTTTRGELAPPFPSIRTKEGGEKGGWPLFTPLLSDHYITHPLFPVWKKGERRWQKNVCWKHRPCHSSLLNYSLTCWLGGKKKREKGGGRGKGGCTDTSVLIFAF